jgi:hypothetical protein
MEFLGFEVSSLLSMASFVVSVISLCFMCVIWRKQKIDFLVYRWNEIGKSEIMKEFEEDERKRKADVEDWKKKRREAYFTERGEIENKLHKLRVDTQGNKLKKSR